MRGDNANAFVLLELLRGEGHGSELSERIFERTNGEVKVSRSLSRQLRDMHREGLLCMREVTAEQQGRIPGPPAKVYALSEFGHAEALRAWAGMRHLLGNPPDGVDR